MKYEFPNILHIDDVLPHIKDSPEFIHAVKDGYTVINYVVAGHDTFPDVEQSPELEFDILAQRNALRRECRGLVFDSETGELINRRYHKFFNVNERDETLLDKIDWSKPHIILEKLDGSMVSPCRVRNHIRWMTKMGVTDTSMEAEAFVAKNPKYALVARMAYDRDLTLIFEWCSNKNRIVLDYPDDRLVLTAVRFNDNGKYMPYDELKQLAAGFDIPLVQAWDSRITHDVLTKIVRQSENIEGVVVRFDDGHMVKIKSDWYVRIHKVKSMLGQERDVVELILKNELDDMLPVLPKEDVERVEKFRVKMEERLRADAYVLDQTIRYTRSGMDRKSFALEAAPNISPVIRGMIFQFWDKECNEHLTYQAIVATILKNCGNNGSYAKVKEAFLKDVNYV
jgi:RNA ligase